jgi:hypothetical protein
LKPTQATIERMPPDLVNRCHIIYRIQDKALQVLKDTDTLSIDAGWYRCHMIAKMHMQETKPANYMFDSEIESKSTIADRYVSSSTLLKDNMYKYSIFVTFALEGFHNWPEAKDIFPEVSFLSDRHRHMFHFKCYAKVTHTDRDEEFISNAKKNKKAT